MMGRWPGGNAKAGQPLADPPDRSTRTISISTTIRHGALCPFHAHIRRANPRNTKPDEGSRPPRIVRRGMSYGPPLDASNPEGKSGSGARPDLHGLQFQPRRTVRGGAALAERRQQLGLVFGPERSAHGLCRIRPPPIFPLRASGQDHSNGARRLGPASRRASSFRAPRVGSVLVRALEEGASMLQGPRGGAAKPEAAACNGA